MTTSPSTTPSTTSDRHRRRIRSQALTVAGAAALLAGMLPAGLTAGAVGAAAATGCRLVELATPAGSPWGTVVDIERIDRRPVYFGTYDRMRRDGEWHPQAAVWRGLRGRPVPVGPRGTDGTVALEMTRNGLVHGSSEDWEEGTTRFWVQDLDSGRLRWWRTDLDGEPSEGAYIRRVNSRGEATGGITPAGSEHEQAVGIRSPGARPFALRVPRRAVASAALGINDRGDRAGFWAEVTPETDPVALFRPSVWDRDGRRHRLATPGLDAEPRAINNRRQLAGSAWIGSIEDGHLEGAYWSSYDRAHAVGLLPGGGMSQLFGLDGGGRALGWADSPGDPEDPMTDPHSGTFVHNVFWAPGMVEGTLRVLPSLHAVRTGETDWTRWHATHAAHAGHARLDQVGAGTHAGFADDGTPVGAPTVFVNASQCGVTVDTSHPDQVDELSAPARRTAGAQGTADPTGGLGALVASTRCSPAAHSAGHRECRP